MLAITQTGGFQPNVHISRIRNEDMAKNETYDYLWDRDGNEEAWNKKYAEWRNRDWEAWLSENLSFPFIAERTETVGDLEDGGYLYQKEDIFGFGHAMKVLSIMEEDDKYGIIVKVREGRRVGHVPLCELQVTPRKNPNYWPVREYAVCTANR